MPYNSRTKGPLSMGASEMAPQELPPASEASYQLACSMSSVPQAMLPRIITDLSRSRIVHCGCSWRVAHVHQQEESMAAEFGHIKNTCMLCQPDG